MTISPSLPIQGWIRLVAYQFFGLFTRLMVALFSVFPNHVRCQIVGVMFLGPRELVEQAIGVMRDLQAACPDLYEVFTPEVPLTICYCSFTPPIKSQAYEHYFFVGDDYLCWGKKGILVHLAWVAHRVKAKLHHPRIAFHNHYTGRVLIKQTSLQMSDWLMANHQPDEWVQGFRGFHLRGEACP